MEVKVVFDDLKVRDVHKLKDVNVVMVKGEKGEAGVPTDEQVQNAVNEWLAEHPGAVASVEFTDPLNDGNVDVSLVVD